MLGAVQELYNIIDSAQEFQNFKHTLKELIEELKNKKYDTLGKLNALVKSIKKIYLNIIEKNREAETSGLEKSEMNTRTPLPMSKETKTKNMIEGNQYTKDKIKRSTARAPQPQPQDFSKELDSLKSQILSILNNYKVDNFVKYFED